MHIIRIVPLPIGCVISDWSERCESPLHSNYTDNCNSQLLNRTGTGNINRMNSLCAIVKLCVLDMYTCIYTFIMYTCKLIIGCYL